MKRVTRNVGLDDVRDLLERPPRASIAFGEEDGVGATPVAFRSVEGAYWVGISPDMCRRAPGAGEEVVLVIDDGWWFFDLRAVYVRGRARPGGTPPRGTSSNLHWLEVVPDKVVAWHYGSLREADDDA